MASVELKYEENGNPVTQTLTLQKWKIYRKLVRLKYNYLTGGRESRNRASQIYFELEWEYLSPAEYGIIRAVLAKFRNNENIWITALNGLQYAEADLIPAGGLLVDVENDTFPLSEGEYVEKMPFKITFVSQIKQA